MLHHLCFNCWDMGRLLRMAVCRNQFFFRCAAKALLSNAHLSVKLMQYLRETEYVYELVCFLADASGRIFLRWCTGLLKNISRLEKDKTRERQ